MSESDWIRLDVNSQPPNATRVIVSDGDAITFAFFGKMQEGGDNVWIFDKEMPGFTPTHWIAAPPLPQKIVQLSALSQ